MCKCIESSSFSILAPVRSVDWIVILRADQFCFLDTQGKRLVHPRCLDPITAFQSSFLAILVLNMYRRTDSRLFPKLLQCTYPDTHDRACLQNRFSHIFVYKRNWLSSALHVLFTNMLVVSINPDADIGPIR